MQTSSSGPLVIEEKSSLGTSLNRHEPESVLRSGSLVRYSKKIRSVSASGSIVRAETIFIPAKGKLVFMTKGFEIVYHKKTSLNQRQVNF